MIALIATPIILGVIDNAKKEAFKDTAYGMIDAAEYYYARQILKGEEIVEKTFTFPNDNELKYNGEKPKTGEIKLDYKGRIKIALYDGKYCASKDYDESTITLTEITLQECVPQPYKDVVLNGSDPILDPGMIPVTIEDNGTVKKADLFKEWYNYNDKKWANAVLVSSDVRDSYNKGDIIPENKILAYFVWIPRYEYETINSETPKEIKINFISKQTVTPSTKYIIHPAFTFDNKELSGFWIGKFETTGSKTTPTIKPNATTIRQQNVSNSFKISLIYGNRTLNTDGSITNNGNKTTYGLISESRIIKNLEWAAVAYLSHSKYGINKEIRINNNSNYITGCGASAENGNSISACQIVYGAVSSYPQSTTGNISGVFDMSGGSYEYVMGVMEDSLNSGNPASGYSASTNSGFNGKYTGGGTKTDGTNFPNPKYYNLYKYGTTYNDNAAYNRTIVGDALKETMRWYNDYSYVVYSSSPWFHRGGGHDNKEMGGIFYSSRTSGEAIDKISFRVVVTITE